MCWSEKSDYNVLKKFYMLKIDGNIGEAVEQEEKLCVPELPVTARTRCG